MIERDKYGYFPFCFNVTLIMKLNHLLQFQSFKVTPFDCHIYIFCLQSNIIKMNEMPKIIEQKKKYLMVYTI